MTNITGIIIFLAYYLLAVAIFPTLLRAIPGIPGEIVRKVRHVGVSLSIFILLERFSSWYMAMIAIALLILIVYPVLKLLERYPKSIALIADRTGKGNDLRRQMLYTLGTFASLLLLVWGVLGHDFRYIIAVAAMAWGFGDAAAALVGRFCGTRHLVHRFIEGAKTWEGTGAMIVSSAAAIFLTLFFYAHISWFISLIVALVVAPIAGIVELFSRRGLDSLTIPFSVTAATLPTVYLLSLLGWA